MTTLGKRLRELRIAEPYLTQRQAAIHIGVTPQVLSRFEADREQPTTMQLERIAEAYSVDLDDLIPLWDRWEPAPPHDMTNVIVCTRSGVDGR